VAALDRLLAWSMPLVSPDGALVAMKGSSAAEEVAAAAPVLAKLGCAEPEIILLGEGVVAEPTSAVRVAWADPSRVVLPPAAQPPADRPRHERSRRRQTGRRR